MTVGGHTDHVVDLCGEDSAGGKRQCLSKGQLTKTPSQAEFQECWSESIIKCGLSPSVVDRRDQEGHLVCDGGFFEGSWGQGFQQDEDSVLHVCG